MCVEVIVLIALGLYLGLFLYFKIQGERIIMKLNSTHANSRLVHERDLISKQDAIEAVVCHIWHMPNEVYRQFNCENVVREVVEDAIKRLPSAEAVQGEWICIGNYAVCSECGGPSGTQFDGVEQIPRATAFCPNCGARMLNGGK